MVLQRPVEPARLIRSYPSWMSLC